jgi:DNA repair protein RadD
MNPRPYQIEAAEALDNHLATSDSNPCIVLPTGAGKTPTMAWTLEKYVRQWPATRAIVLAHNQELIRQGIDKMLSIWPAAPVGVFSAGLGQRNATRNITYATIGSVYKRALDFDPFDLIYIDEAHRIPLADEGQYRQFLREAKLNNPAVRAVGWTATPYRLAGGSIVHKDYILNEIIYSANVATLIADGYLSKLRTKAGAAEIDTSEIHKRGGEFVTKELETAAMAEVDGIVAESVRILERERRKHVLFFCVTVEHATAVSQALALLKWHAPVVEANTKKADRNAYTAAFAAGKLRALCNVNILSEGFDAPCVDAVVMIRPTESKGLYYQQVGRGLRLSPGKSDCLILDFAGNVAKHGPIDQLEGCPARTRTCGNCREVYAEAVGNCPQCGWEPPPSGLPGGEGPKGAEREIPKDPRGRSEAAILSSDGAPWTVEVADVLATLHTPRDAAKTPTLKVQYLAAGGMESYSEWICLGHSGFAREKARRWWAARFPGEPVPASAAEAITSRLFLSDELKQKTESITVRQAGRFAEIVAHRLRANHLAAVAN